MTPPTTDQTPQEPKTLNKIAQKIFDEVSKEVPEAGVFRHQLNKISPSFPRNYRSLANADVHKTGPREHITIGGRVYYPKAALLEHLREYLLAQ